MCSIADEAKPTIVDAMLESTRMAFNASRE
jgi:hypothetical protein